MTTTTDTHVVGQETVEDTYVKQKGRFLIFPTTWWEKVSTKHIGNDIYIETNRPIRNVYLNSHKIN